MRRDGRCATHGPLGQQRGGQSPCRVTNTATRGQPEDHYERAAGRRYRAVVARALTGAADRFGPPPQPKTRVGIAADFGLRQRRCHEDHARAVGRRLGLTDGRIQRANHVFGSR